MEKLLKNLDQNDFLNLLFGTFVKNKNILLMYVQVFLISRESYIFLD